MGNGKSVQGLLLGLCQRKDCSHWLHSCHVVVTQPLSLLRRCGGGGADSGPRCCFSRGMVDFAAEVTHMLHGRFATTGWGMQGAWSVPTGKMTFDLTCLLNNNILLNRNASSYSKMNALFLRNDLFSWQTCTSFSKLTVFPPIKNSNILRQIELFRNVNAIPMLYFLHFRIFVITRKWKFSIRLETLVSQQHHGYYWSN